MRRERIIAVLAVLAAAFGVTLSMPALASAATPSEICTDLADGTLTPNKYTQAEIAAYLEALRTDPLIQGYCNPLVVVYTPPQQDTPECVEVPANTPGAVQAPNGKWYTPGPNGNADMCGPAKTTTTPQAAVTPQPECVEVAPNSPGAAQAPNGKWYANAPNGNAAACGPAAPAPKECVEVAPNTTGAVQASNGKWYANAPNGNAEACAPKTAAPAPTAAVAGTTKEQTAAPQAPTKPANNVAAAAPAPQAAPLGTTRATGTLPFTGAQLAVFAIVGAALIGGGLLLRMTARRERHDA